MPVTGGGKGATAVVEGSRTQTAGDPVVTLEVTVCVPTTVEVTEDLGALTGVHLFLQYRLHRLDRRRPPAMTFRLQDVDYREGDSIRPANLHKVPDTVFAMAVLALSGSAVPADRSFGSAAELQRWVRVLNRGAGLQRVYRRIAASGSTTSAGAQEAANLRGYRLASYLLSKAIGAAGA